MTISLLCGTVATSLCSDHILNKFAVVSIIVLAAIAFAVAAKPVSAVKDFRTLSTTVDTAEGVLAGGSALASGTLATGTIRSLVRRTGKPVKGLEAVEAFVFSVSGKGSYTLWLIAAAKLLTAIATVFEYSAVGYVTTTIATIVWLGVIGSAIAAVFLLLTKEELGISENMRVMKARSLGLVVFVIALIATIFLSFM